MSRSELDPAENDRRLSALVERIVLAGGSQQDQIMELHDYCLRDPNMTDAAVREGLRQIVTGVAGERPPPE